MTTAAKAYNEFVTVFTLRYKSFSADLHLLCADNVVYTVTTRGKTQYSCSIDVNIVSLRWFTTYENWYSKRVDVGMFQFRTNPLIIP